ncbi:MAG: nucleotidyltransferase domain-containing protein [Nitrospirota bacterium]
MSEHIQRLLKELKEHLGQLYGARLRGVYLFGSYARGEADEASDMDVLIVLDRVDNYSQEIDRTGEVVSTLSLRSGVTISRVFASEQRWQTDQTNFFLNVREEAVPA